MQQRRRHSKPERDRGAVPQGPLLVAGPDVRIIAEDGELIRALTLDPTRVYHPLGGRWPVHNVLPQECTMS